MFMVNKDYHNGNSKC